MHWENPNVNLFSLKISGEGRNFKQSNFRMADISNLKINEVENVERPNWQESLQ